MLVIRLAKAWPDGASNLCGNKYILPYPCPSISSVYIPAEGKLAHRKAGGPSKSDITGLMIAGPPPYMNPKLIQGLCAHPHTCCSLTFVFS